MPPAVEWAPDQGGMMFCLLIQGAGPLCQRYRGIEPLQWLLCEVVIRQPPRFDQAEVWDHQWAQDRGIPWART